MVPGTLQLPLQTSIKSHFSLYLEHTNRHISPNTVSWSLPLGHSDISGSVGSEALKQGVISLPCSPFCCQTTFSQGTQLFILQVENS